jgi:hypothetical protein
VEIQRLDGMKSRACQIFGKSKRENSRQRTERSKGNRPVRISKRMKRRPGNPQQDKITATTNTSTTEETNPGTSRPQEIAETNKENTTGKTELPRNHTEGKIQD